MQNDSFLIIASRILSGEASYEDQVELENYFEANDLYKKKFKLLKEYWENKSSVTTDTDKVLQKIMMQINEKEDEGEKSSVAKNRTKAIQFFFTASKVAIVISVCFVTAFFLLKKSSDHSIETPHLKEIQWETRATPKGQKLTIMLPDSTRVVMNSDSRLKLPTRFSGNTREVYLTGEAFFDVTHNAKIPFIIHTNKMNIKVLGTEFNVKSYPEDSTSETTLIRGLIEVTLNDRPSDKIILRPKEKLVVSNEPSPKRISSITSSSSSHEATLLVSSLHYVSAKDSAIVETSWMNNKLVFEGENFSKLATELERRYGVNIRFTNNEVKKFQFTGVFEKESIGEVLKALQLTEKFNYKIEANNITIF